MNVIYRYIAFPLLGIISLSMNGQVGAPVIGCTQVAGNGNTTLSWVAPLDPLGQFVAYHIWNSSTPTGVFTEIAVINTYGTVTYTHATVNPLTSDECYYIITESSDGTNTWLSVPSATVCTISLDAVPSTTPIGYVDIGWTNPYPGGMPGVGMSYDLTMEYPAGTWTNIQSFDAGEEDWQMLIDLCAVNLNFQITMTAPSGCQHVSDIAGGPFTDLIPPDIPIISSVSVDHTTNDAVITWEPSLADDTEGYIIYGCNGNLLAPIDTVFGAAVTTFVDLLANTSIGPVCYSVAAFDGCYSGVPPSPNTSPTADECNCSVYLDPIAYTVCSEEISMTWSAYSGWTNGVASYNIYHNLDGGAYELVGSVAGDILTFTHLFSSIVSGNHGYYIQAISNDGFEAESNLRIVTVIYPEAPSFNYLSSASVLSDTEIEVMVETELVATEHRFHLERFRPSNSTWDEIIAIDNLGGTQVSLQDDDVNTQAFSYTYRVVVENLCGEFVDTSNIGKSMVLIGLANSVRVVNVLQWTHYDGWENGVSKYVIHRKIGQNGTDEVIGEVNGVIDFYEDDVSELLYTVGEFCYRIEAVEDPSSLFPGTAFSAFSNEICMTQEPKIWVPNAFVVDGFNTTFQPVISFADFNNYKMFIYSRWGDVIYETTDINSPWDGTFKGELVQEGAYAYFISVEDGNGKPITAAGTVIMLSQRDQ